MMLALGHDPVAWTDRVPLCRGRQRHRPSTQCINKDMRSDFEKLDTVDQARTNPFAESNKEPIV